MRSTRWPFPAASWFGGSVRPVESQESPWNPVAFFCSKWWYSKRAGKSGNVTSKDEGTTMVVYFFHLDCGSWCSMSWIMKRNKPESFEALLVGTCRHLNFSETESLSILLPRSNDHAHIIYMSSTIAQKLTLKCRQLYHSWTVSDLIHRVELWLRQVIISRQFWNLDHNMYIIVYIIYNVYNELLLLYIYIFGFVKKKAVKCSLHYFSDKPIYDICIYSTYLVIR
jgi:hypothetical protein